MSDNPRIGSPGVGSLGETYSRGTDTSTRPDRHLWSQRNPRYRHHSLPGAYAEIFSSDEEEHSLHDRGKVLRTPEVAHRLTPPPVLQEDSGLPPTPPSATAKDVKAKARVKSPSPLPRFADTVRNDLHTRVSGRMTPGRHLPTPEPSPPTTSHELGSPTMLQPPPAVLRRNGSSRAASFHTAHENASASQVDLPQTPYSEAATTTYRSFDSPHASTPRGTHRTVTSGSSTAPARRRTYVSSDSDSEDSDHAVRKVPPKQSRQSQRSPPRYNLLSIVPDLETGVSHGLSQPLEGPSMSTISGRPVFLSPVHLSDPASVEDVNNLVYRHIQRENVKRHSLLSEVSTIPVVVYQTPHVSGVRTLKRSAKHESLRGRLDREGGNIERRHSLKHKRASISSRDLETSPLGIPAEQIAIPASRLDGSSIAVASGRARKSVARTGGPRVVSSESTPARQHTLRRSPKVDHLEHSPSVSRKIGYGPVDAGRVLVQPESPTLGHGRTIRHFSREAKLENNSSVRRTSLNSPASSPRSPLRAVSSPRSMRRPLSPIAREVGSDAPLSSTHQPLTGLGLHLDPPPVLDGTRSYTPKGVEELEPTAAEKSPSSPQSPRRASLRQGSDSLYPATPRRSLDARFLHPIMTPGSQFSDRTEAELCEARGVNIYPHNNDSVLLVQHGFHPITKDDTIPPPHNFLKMTESQTALGRPTFTANIQEPSPKIGNSSPPRPTIDSPLTNPRAAPEPPAFLVIPPTPSEELDRQISSSSEGQPPHQPQRRRTILERARRYSETLIIVPLFGRRFSTRRRRSDSHLNIDEARPTNLSPLWKPRGFWDDFDSDDEYGDDDFYYDDEPVRGTLPRGGDTSNLDEDARHNAASHPRQSSVFPRSMSVRLPGPRGNGGFLLGNSVGIDRHGTNNRRHFVPKTLLLRSSSAGSKPSSFLAKEAHIRKRASGELLRGTFRRNGRSNAMRDRLFTSPFASGGTQYYGMRRLREKMSAVRAIREERASEKRRAKLRGQISVAR